MTKRQREILDIMAEHQDDEDGEIVQDGLLAYIGAIRISARSIWALIRLAAISEDEFRGGCRRYRINETGLRLLSGETTPDEMRAFFARARRKNEEDYESGLS